MLHYSLKILKSKQPYKTLNHALRLFKGQVMECIPYAQKELPKFKTPEEIFNWLKLRTKYKNDPKDTELFQTIETLLDHNFHGQTGLGDCDCFTIALLTLLLANGFFDCGIVLVGRSKYQPVHIYAYVIDKGEKKFLDNTNRYFNQTRKYPYYQEIPFKLTQQQKNEIMNLQLAETPMYNGSMMPNLQDNLEKNYIHLPSQGIYVRKDYFDKHPLKQLSEMLEDEGYSMSQIQELASARDRRIKKKEQQNADKSELKKAKAQLIRNKGEAKINKSNRPGFDPNKLVDAAGNVIGKFTNKGGGADAGADTTQTAPAGNTIWGMPAPVVYVGGALLVLGVGAAVVKMTRKKRNPAIAA